MLILPGHPLFSLTLETARRPDWKQIADRDGDTFCFLADPETGMMRPAGWQETQEYLQGGEYDERLDAIEAEDVDPIS